jgi:hypothetical protein
MLCQHSQLTEHVSSSTVVNSGSSDNGVTATQNQQ